VASGDYGDQWIPILAKATTLSSDSDSSGLANDCSGSDNVSECIEDRSLTPPTGRNGSVKRRDLDMEGKDGKEVTVSLMDSDSKETIEEDCRCGKFMNQFVTVLKRSFLCVSRDMMLTHLRFASTILVGLLIGTY